MRLPDIECAAGRRKMKIRRKTETLETWQQAAFVLIIAAAGWKCGSQVPILPPWMTHRTTAARPIGSHPCRARPS